MNVVRRTLSAMQTAAIARGENRWELVSALTAVFLLAYNQNVEATHAEVAELEDALA